MAGQRQWVLSECKRNKTCVVGNSRKLYYGKDGVLVKVVEPTSVAGGWLKRPCRS